MIAETTANKPRAARTERGVHKRQSILQVAVQLASQEGLEQLTIGRLAAKLPMSKSGLFAHFGSKEALQVATIEAAARTFVDEIIRPTLAHPKGLARLQALCDAWFSYLERKVFEGGCFFATASNEYKSRPGALHDLLAAKMENWLHYLTGLIQEARTRGQLRVEVEADQLAFEIHALFMGANWSYQLHGDARSIAWARRALRQRLQVPASSAQEQQPF